MNSPPDFILARDELARGIRYRAPHVVPNPSDCYVYGLADELAAEGYVTAREVPDLDARIRANTLAPAEDDREDAGQPADPTDGWEWFTGSPSRAGVWSVYAPGRAAEQVPA